jgi:hypothetical protein
MSRPDQITCLCGACFGVVAKIAGEMIYETRCRKCKRTMSVRIAESGISVRNVTHPLKGHGHIGRVRSDERRYQLA